MGVIRINSWKINSPSDGLADQFEENPGGVEDPEGSDGGDVGRQDVGRVDPNMQKLLLQNGLQVPGSQ